MKTVNLILVDKKELNDILKNHNEDVALTDSIAKDQAGELFRLRQIMRGTIFRIHNLPTYEITHEVEK